MRIHRTRVASIVSRWCRPTSLTSAIHAERCVEQRRFPGVAAGPRSRPRHPRARTARAPRACASAASDVGRVEARDTSPPAAFHLIRKVGAHRRAHRGRCRAPKRDAVATSTAGPPAETGGRGPRSRAASAAISRPLPPRAGRACRSKCPTRELARAGARAPAGQRVKRLLARPRGSRGRAVRRRLRP